MSTLQARSWGTNGVHFGMAEGLKFTLQDALPNFSHWREWAMQVMASSVYSKKIHTRGKAVTAAIYRGNLSPTTKRFLRVGPKILTQKTQNKRKNSKGAYGQSSKPLWG